MKRSRICHRYCFLHIPLVSETPADLPKAPKQIPKPNKAQDIGCLKWKGDGQVIFIFAISDHLRYRLSF